MTNAALVAKLEQAQEGSRALSDEVLLALGWTTQPGWDEGTNWISPEGNEHGDSADSRPDPTCSQGDAVDVVPVFHAYVELHIEPIIDGCDRVCMAQIRIDNDTRHVGTSATPALALSAANVKAVEAGDG